MATRSTSNVIIRNNTVTGGGIWSVTPNTPSGSVYDQLVSVKGTALIEGNIFSTPAENSDMLKTADGDMTIRDNKFIRGSTNITAYIRHTPNPSFSDREQITDNSFDDYTIDGTNEQLVYGLSIRSIYTRNINQTGFAYIPIHEQSISSPSIGLFPLESRTLNFTTSQQFEFQMTKGQQNLNTIFNNSLNVANAKSLWFRRGFNLDSHLEKGVKFVSCRVGAHFDATKSSAFTDSFGVIFKMHDSNKSLKAENYSTSDGYAIDHQYEIDNQSAFDALLNGTTFTPYVNFSFGGPFPDDNYNGFNQPDYYTIGNGYNFEVEFYTFITFDAGTSYTASFTPIEVKYRW